MNSKELQDLAYLARLKFQEADINTFVSDFEKVMNYVDKINELDTSSISDEEIYSYFSIDSTREDEIKNSLNRDEISIISPKFENGYIVVPKVIET